MNIFNMSNVVQVGIISTIASIMTLCIKLFDKDINKKTIYLLNFVFNAMLVLCINISYFCFISSWAKINMLEAVIQIIAYMYICTVLSQIFYDKVKDIKKGVIDGQDNNSNNSSNN